MPSYSVHLKHCSSYKIVFNSLGVHEHPFFTSVLSGMNSGPSTRPLSPGGSEPPLPG